ncbi:ACT domain-containing protein [Pseudomonas sp. HS6]|uniref:ACT domain-containing protein n=1 Tax=Pseudomonas sp. HS6 TaxID=2850559 RepID=UPI00201A008B|nr:ACT domain-containing protein [Pseudomonas sp. HS6]UQS17169.1 ACT domain-containing protein [Pseudomonas sp. HS6]
MAGFELVFKVHESLYSVYRLKGIPNIACLSASADVLSLSIAPNENTLICRSDLQVTGCEIDQASLTWRCLEVVSEHPADVVGLIAFVSHVLAGAGISLLTISTFAGDLFFIKDESLAQACGALSAAGNTVIQPAGPTRSRP